MMNQVYRFCIEEGLLTEEQVSKITCFYERCEINPVEAALIQMNLSERDFYKLAAGRFNLPIITLDQIDMKCDFSEILSINYQSIYKCRIFSDDGKILKVVTDDFFNRELPVSGVKSKTGREVELYLMTRSEFDVLERYGQQ